MPRIVAFEAGGKPILRGKDHLWSVMLELDRAGPFTVRDVDDQTNMPDISHVWRYVKALHVGGFLVVVGEVPARSRNAVLYQVAQRVPHAPRLDRDGMPSTYGRRIQNMWNVLRGPGAGTGIRPEELALLASTEACPVTLASAKDYLYALSMAGCLQVVKPAKKGRNGHSAAYRLPSSRRTGPLAPMVMATRMVFDPNTNSIVKRELEAVEVDL